MNVQTPNPAPISPLAIIPAWQDTEAKLIVGGGVVPVKTWRARDWREMVELWSKGVKANALEQMFMTRGYTAHEIRLLRILLFTNAFILPPIERALFVLGGLARCDAAAPGGFTLYGRPARSTEVVATANRMLGALGLPQIRYPSAGCEA